MPATLVVIGFHAANAALVSKSVAEGTMPAVAARRRPGFSETIAASLRREFG